MIQRIQTLYLLLATAMMSLTLFLPLATIVYGGNELVLKAFTLSGVESIEGTLPVYLGAFLAVTTALLLVIIFLYKKRLVQIRLCVSTIVLLLGSAGLIGLYCYRLCDILSGDLVFTLGFASLMPIVAIIPVALAIRAIARDEALVRSLDRIR
jgi:hypothetical protein